MSKLTLETATFLYSSVGYEGFTLDLFPFLKSAIDLVSLLWRYSQMCSRKDLFLNSHFVLLHLIKTSHTFARKDLYVLRVYIFFVQSCQKNNWFPGLSAKWLGNFCFFFLFWKQTFFLGLVLVSPNEFQENIDIRLWRGLFSYAFLKVIYYFKMVRVRDNSRVGSWIICRNADIWGKMFPSRIWE